MSASEGYELVRRIGTGTSSAVYLGKTAAGEVAIRQFESKADPGSQEWRDQRQAFLQAGNQGLTLVHPRIVPVLEVIDEAGEAFVVMQFMPAATMATALKDGRRFTPEESSAILEQIAAALDFAHGRGVVHGDLKPADIFLAQKGAAVSDFAISPRALVLNAHGPVPAHLIHQYLSPEHLRDAALIESRSDQYSLATIAYQMYTGRFPYGEPVIDLSQAILTAPVIPPTRVDPNLPPGIDAPLLRALDRDPRQRYASCMELVALLGASLIVRPDAERRPFPKLVFILAPLLLLLLAALMWLSSRPSHVSPTIAHNPGTPAPVATPAVPAPARSTPVHGPKTTKATSKPPIVSGTVAPSPPAPRRETQPPVRDEETTVASAGVPANSPFTIDVLSRGTQRVVETSSFPFLDPQRGELAQGDLKALISFSGQRSVNGPVEVDWTVDGLVMAREFLKLKPGRGAQQAIVTYRNEPTTGTYQVTVMVNKKPVQKFTFSITQ